MVETLAVANQDSAADILQLKQLDTKLGDAAESLLIYSNGLRSCFGANESADSKFTELRNTVVQDSTAFGKIVAPVSIVVMKELYSMTEFLKMCENPDDFIGMAEVLKE